MREALSSHPPPSSILQSRMPGRSSAMAAKARQPTISSDPEWTGKASGSIPSVSLSMRRTSTRSPRPGNAPCGTRFLLHMPGAGQRGSAPANESEFFCCDRPGCEEHFARTRRNPGRSIAADPAVRLCIGCSSENGCGESERSRRDDDHEQVRAAGPEFVGGYVPRPHDALRFLRPQREEGAGGFRDHSGPPAPFLRSSNGRQGDDSVPRRSGLSCTSRRIG